MEHARCMKRPVGVAKQGCQSQNGVPVKATPIVKKGKLDLRKRLMPP
jgi:hypothetical protein